MTTRARAKHSATTTWAITEQVYALDLAAMGLDVTDQRVLLAYAGHANREGIAWPSVGRLAWKLHLSERHVQRSLKSLRELRLLTPEGPGTGGRGRPTPYRLTLDDAPTRQPFRGEKGDALMTSFADGKGDSQLSPLAPRKGDATDPERATSSPIKGDNSLPNGDTQVSPEHQQEQSNSQLLARSHAAAGNKILDALERRYGPESFTKLSNHFLALNGSLDRDWLRRALAKAEQEIGDTELTGEQIAKAIKLAHEDVKCSLGIKNRDAKGYVRVPAAFAWHVVLDRLRAAAANARDQAEQDRWAPQESPTTTSTGSAARGLGDPTDPVR